MSMYDIMAACPSTARFSAARAVCSPPGKRALHLLEPLPIERIERRQVLDQPALMELAPPCQASLGERDAKTASHVAGQVDQRRGAVALARWQPNVSYGRSGHEQKRDAGGLD